MAITASGSFEVKMLPPAHPDATAPSAGITLGRLLLDKRYRGDLQASAHGQMLSAVTPTSGSAGYVAIEQASGTLHGRSGSFVLQHSGIMSRGAKNLTINVVPDSATGELAGLAGQMDIRISDGQHFYEFIYTLP
jgi:hypothetical protein